MLIPMVFKTENPVGRLLLSALSGLSSQETEKKGVRYGNTTPQAKLLHLRCCRSRVFYCRNLAVSDLV